MGLVAGEPPVEGMHLAEGVCSGPVLIGGAFLGAVGTAIGLRLLRDEDIPRTAMLTTVIFVASLIHVPIGPGSVHLILSGLCGILIGWPAFPAILISLFLQAILFGFGGLTVLGVNLTILAAPAAILGSLARSWWSRKPDRIRKAPFLAGLVAALSIAASGVLAATALWLSDRAFAAPALLILAAHLPVMAVEAVITGGLVGFLARARPDMLIHKS